MSGSSIEARYFNTELMNAWELDNLLQLAELTTMCALATGQKVAVGMLAKIIQTEMT